MYQMFASLSEQERNRFLNQVQANPTFEGVERLQEAPSASTVADEAAVSEPPASAATPQEMGMDFMDTVATEDMPVPASDAEAVHPLVVAAPPAQTPAPAACPALSKAKQGLPVPMKTPPPRAGDDGQTHAPPKLWPKQGASSSAGTPKVPAVDKAKPASPKTAEPKVIAKEKARPPPLVPEETEIQEEPPLPAPAAPPTEPTPPKTSFPPAAGETRHTPKASFPPAAGESRQSEVDRAPSLAAAAPASRVGSVINDADGNPLFCLVQLWACRKRCESCENAFCQATFADRTSAYHARHRCRDCNRTEGRAAAHQQPSWPSQSWESSPAWDSWQEPWSESWNENWGENWGQPAWR
eukprot:s6274_g4.t1